MNIPFVVWCLLMVLCPAAIHSDDSRKPDPPPSCPDNVGFGLELILAKLESLELEIMTLKEQNRNLTDLVAEALTVKGKSSAQVTKTGTKSAGEKISEDEKVVHANESEPEVDESHVYSSCFEVPQGKSGQYAIRVGKEHKPFYAYCEMQLYGGGWTVIQMRFNGSESFYRNWKEYKAGFGSLSGEFWFGLDRIHLLTNAQTHEIMFHLMDFNRLEKNARYNSFAIGNETEGYKIKSLGSYTGSAGDGFSYHKGMKFTTYDVDNDKFTENCAKNYYGAWWYNGCYKSNLNAKYINARNGQAMCWNPFKGGNDGLMTSIIMIRPV